jgi:hypothetical protein
MVRAVSAKPPSAARLMLTGNTRHAYRIFTGGKSWRSYLEDGGEDGGKYYSSDLSFLQLMTIKLF